MELRYTAEEIAFRDELRAFFRTQIPAAIRRKVSEGRALARAAKQIWKALPADRKRGQILVTGAWADPEDGCATAVHNTLLDLGAHSTLSELSPIFGEEDEETEEP